ncbi:MAG: hypothetical protein CL920_20775 [Deltaproteobacteria bacterium]|nr:hypothetical protein [Deltaproteobacteria bacterium]MBU51129.1 hypothetical protein [Deltaproteobacteria bacterium]
MTSRYTSQTAPVTYRPLLWLTKSLILLSLVLFSCTSTPKGECEQDGQCPAAKPHCSLNKCQQCLNETHCPNGQTCIAGLCETQTTETTPTDGGGGGEGSENLCGNGRCDIGVEDCLSCAQDCQCPAEQYCQAGTCKQRDECGNGTCDSNETCAICPQDCACTKGQICLNNSCKEQASCGNGTCEGAENENCLSCPSDCTCPGGQSCDPQSSSCQGTCGNGTCDTNLGENCTTCTKDCTCRQSQTCVEGRCEWTCGNGRCETAYGEDCSTCPSDCPCPNKQVCKVGACGSNCGDGKCDATAGENCSTCAKDCACESGLLCSSGRCGTQCGNQICDVDKGETCSTCPQDCVCPKTHECSTGQCKHRCGNRKCEKQEGETCATCPTDCACTSDTSCVDGTCKCIPNCNNKTCGDDGCGGSCGTCTGLTTCQSGKCTCQHKCQEGYKKCTSTSSYERCDPDSQGCRSIKTYQCQSGGTCKDGSCCALACQGKTCGPDGCGGNCGICPPHSECQSSNCVCKHECAENARQCVGQGYQTCLKDANGCRYWSTTRTCLSSQTCINGSCCTSLCSTRECGGDGCGKSCGTCSDGCINNKCLRKMEFTKIYFPCGTACTDTIGKPDIYLELTLPNGQTYKSKEITSSCDSELTFNWSLSRIDPFQLKNAKLSVLDNDGSLYSPEVCGIWTGDLSPFGTQTLTHTKVSGLKLTFTVKR